MATPMTYEQVLSKLTALCARGEHCLQDMRTKMERWQIDADIQGRVLDYLVTERYIDEERYARFFINDKVKYNKWGKRKIVQALYMKKIPEEVYAPLLKDVEEEDYERTLLPLLVAKAKTVKGDSNYEKRMKLVRYALQRGFSYEQAQRCMEKIEIFDE